MRRPTKESRIAYLEIQVGGGDANVKLTLWESEGGISDGDNVASKTPWDLGGLFFGAMMGLLFALLRAGRHTRW